MFGSLPAIHKVESVEESLLEHRILEEKSSEKVKNGRFGMAVKKENTTETASDSMCQHKLD